MAKKRTIEKKGKTIIVKRKLHLSESEVHGKTPASYFKRMREFESDGYTRDNMFGTEIIWGGHKHYFSKKKAAKAYKYFYIFSLVKKDAKKYLETHELKNIKPIPAQHENNKIKTMRNKKLAGVDLDSAYWNMAFQKNIIRESTFDKGLCLPPKYKSMGLSALSSLGTDKRYHIIRNGQMTNDIKIIKGDDRLKEVYMQIRYECYKIMRSLARVLKNDYVRYRTDCLYFIYNERTKRVVEDFMNKRGLDFKIEVEPKRTRQNKEINP
jgi:hypothetical protein